MNVLEAMKSGMSYVSTNEQNPYKLQETAHLLCWQYNQTSPQDAEKRAEILHQLFGTCSDQTVVNSSFQCDYGFNIHTSGL